MLINSQLCSLREWNTWATQHSSTFHVTADLLISIYTYTLVSYTKWLLCDALPVEFRSLRSPCLLSLGVHFCHISRLPFHHYLDYFQIVSTEPSHSTIPITHFTVNLSPQWPSLFRESNCAILLPHCLQHRLSYQDIHIQTSVICSQWFGHHGNTYLSR